MGVGGDWHSVKMLNTSSLTVCYMWYIHEACDSSAELPTTLTSKKDYSGLRGF